MAEPTDTQSHDWNSLPNVLLEQISSRMDLLSTVRLAACSVSLYHLLVCNRPALFKTPCLLMPDPRRWPRHRLDDPTKVVVVPLDMLPLPVHQSFMRGHYWAGMKANWIVLIHHTVVHGVSWISTPSERSPFHRWIPPPSSLAARRTLLPTTHETRQAFGSTSVCRKL